MEITHTAIKYTTDFYSVVFETDHGRMVLDVQVTDNSIIDEHIENSETDVWNKLSYEEKNEIDEMLENEFIS